MQSPDYDNVSNHFSRVKKKYQNSKQRVQQQIKKYERQPN